MSENHDVPVPVLYLPFDEPGTHGQVAVKVIDDRGNELLVVKNIKEAKG